MVKLRFSRLFAFFSFMSLIAFISCNKKDEMNDGMPALYSFGPTGAKHGDTIRFVGANLDKVSAIKFFGVNAIVDQKQFTTQNADLIKLVVPVAAEKGFVILRLSTGDSLVSKTQFNLNVLSRVTSVTSSARPGSDITITGTYLNWIDRVTFNRVKLLVPLLPIRKTGWW